MRGLNRLAAWRRLADSRRWMLFQAQVYLWLARLTIRFVPFHRLTWIFTRPALRPELTGEARQRVIQDVRWAIWTHTRHQRERIVCFPRGVVVQAMLRERGVSTTLYYGARTTSDKGLEAHVWVQDGERGIIGHRRAMGHKVLAQFPTPSLTPLPPRDEQPAGAAR